ncbi:MAG: helix-turn-helix domain-containing protein [bacterium]
MPQLIEKLLKKFGLNEKEIKVYLACLEIGTAFAGHIAKKTGLNRSTCYVILEQLIKKGLVSKSGNEKKFQFAAEKPERLLSLIKERQAQDAILEKDLNKFLPELQSSFSSKNKDFPKIKFFEGAEGIKAVLQDSVESTAPGNSFYHYGPNLEADMETIGRDFVGRIIEQRVKKGVFSKALVGKNPWTISKKEVDKKEKREIVFLPPEIKAPAKFYIYANKVAIFSLDEEPVGVLIENENISKTMEIFFQALWEKCKAKK